MQAVDADVWILTETHVDHGPGDSYQSVHTPAFPERRPESERWVGIWSKLPLRAIEKPAPSPRGTVAVVVDAPFGELIVYGCVIPWANEPELTNRDSATMWQAHAETIDQIDDDLRTIEDAHPGVPIVVAGDFNQDRDGSGWYGTHAVRDQLTEVLARHDLACLTCDDVVASGLLESQHLIDHICASTSLAQNATMSCWEATDRDDVRLSDHPTVAVDLSAR